ncbi:hypothetical protein [Siccirubricoccus sp. G192]|uniref:hypothetical protein n=1 Tax=Siccirubricoccus sp. G192 TaxID=2849651 RepID=UPI0035C82902
MRAGARRQADAEVVLHEATGLDEFGRGQALPGDQGARAEQGGGGHLVRLPGHQGDQPEARLADPQHVAERQPQPFRDQRVERHRAGGKRHRRVQHQFTIEGIGGIHRLQLHQQPVLGGRYGIGAPGGGDQHGAERHHLGGRAAAGGDPGADLRPRRAGAAADLDIAAEDAGAIRGQPGLQPGPQGAHRGDGGDAQRQAGQHDPQAPDPAAQFPPRQAEAEHHLAETAQPILPAACEGCEVMPDVADPRADCCVSAPKPGEQVAWKPK